MLCAGIIPKPFLPSPICGKIVFHENGPWCQKGWGPGAGIAALQYRVPGPSLCHLALCLQLHHSHLWLHHHRVFSPCIFFSFVRASISCPGSWAPDVRVPLIFISLGPDAPSSPYTEGVPGMHGERKCINAMASLQSPSLEFWVFYCQLFLWIPFMYQIYSPKWNFSGIFFSTFLYSCHVPSSS